MKVIWTCSRETIAVVPPRALKEDLKQIFAISDKKHNGYVTVTIETPRKPRTTGENSQNHHVNGHIQQIAEQTGNAFDVVKLEVKCRAVGMGYPIATREDGTMVTDIHGRPAGISESESSAAECAVLIEAAHMLAAELGIILQEE